MCVHTFFAEVCEDNLQDVVADEWLLQLTCLRLPRKGHTFLGKLDDATETWKALQLSKICGSFIKCVHL